MSNCGICRHWEKFTLSTAQPGWGRCHAINPDAEYDTESNTLACIGYGIEEPDDYYDNASEFWTHQAFGCLLFKKRKEDE